MNTKLAKMVKVAMLIALSVVGAFIKIPSPTGTIALDSLPGYFGAIVIGRREGALIAGLGHLASALSTGFPLSLPVHLAVAVEMVVCVYLFGLIKEKFGYIPAVIAGIILNGVISPVLLIPLIGKALFLAILLPLFVISAVNIILAAVVSKRFIKTGA